MRTAALFIAFVAFTCAASAQFSLLPQVGFENSKTVIRYNDLNTFSPLGVRFSPQASLRLDYSTKQGHGFFAGVAASRSTVLFNVADAENVLNSYKASMGSMQIRMEGGYQFKTQPIYFSGAKAKQSSQAAVNKSSGKGSCYSRSRCGSAKPKTEKTAASVAKGAWMRIQPSIGMGFIPSVRADVAKTGPSAYEYRAGNWNTALLTGVNVEFGKNRNALFTVSLNYFNALGNLGKQTISTVQSSKTTTSILQSDVSGWNMRVGIPFSLNHKKSAVKTKTENKVEHPRQGCGQYRIIYRCRRTL